MILLIIYVLTLPLWFVLCYGMDRAHSKAIFLQSTCQDLRGMALLVILLGAFLGPIGVLVFYFGTNFAEHGFTLE